MDINLNNFYYPISFVKEKWLMASPQQKQIFAIASLALSCLTAAYLVWRCCLKGRAQEKKAQDQTQISKEVAKVEGKEIAKEEGKEEALVVSSPAKTLEKEKVKPLEVPAEESALTESVKEKKDSSKEPAKEIVKEKVTESPIKKEPVNSPVKQPEVVPNSQLISRPIVTDKHGRKWEGEFDETFTGQGKMTNRNGTVRDGHFKNGKLNGEGTYTNVSGSKLKGLFQNDALQSGHGKLIKADKILEGEFQGDLLNGEGTITHPNKKVETGQFINNVLQKGKITESSGRVRDGHFQGGKLHGQGKISYLIGVDASQEGQVLGEDEGQFQDDLLDGEGEKRYPGGKVEKGTFSKGKFITPSEGDKIEKTPVKKIENTPVKSLLGEEEFLSDSPSVKDEEFQISPVITNDGNRRFSEIQDSLPKKRKISRWSGVNELSPIKK